MPAFLEKRIDERAEISEEAKFKILSDAETTISFGYETAKTRNISKGGLCMLANRKMAEGSVIRIEIPFVESTSSMSRPIKAFCEVQWCRQADSNSYEIGLSFIALKEEDVEYLTKYISTQQRAM